MMWHNDKTDFAVQSTLTGSMQSMHAGWRCSLLTHVLCGQLAGLARHGSDVEDCSAALCAEVCTTPVASISCVSVSAVLQAQPFLLSL